MRLLTIAFVFAVAVASTACSSQVACECPSFAPAVTVTVTEASSGELVADPEFAVNGASAPTVCAGFAPSDAGSTEGGDAGAPVCEQWRVTLPVGHSTLTVSAPGFQPQTFAYDTVMSGGCCGGGTQLTQSVLLAP